MRIVIVALAALAAVSCGGESDRSVLQQPSDMPVSVTVNPPASNILRIGIEQAYSASVRYGSGVETTETAAWRSDAPAVAAIDNGGRARGVDTGDATLVASVKGLEGTLRIRVVPDFQGRWAGLVASRSCSESGFWTRTDICRDLFTGAGFPVGFDLRQDRDRVGGTMNLDGMDVAMNDGTIRGDGAVSTSGAITLIDDGMTLVYGFDPLELRARAGAMSGTLRMTVTLTGQPGSVVVEFDLRDVSRSMSMTAMSDSKGRAPMAQALRRHARRR